MRARPPTLLALVLVAVSCRSSPHGAQHAPPAIAVDTRAVGAAAPPHAAPHDASTAEDAHGEDPCHKLPFFRIYEIEQAVERAGAHLVVHADIDLHALDCMAPDSYGHRMQITLALRSRDGRCEIEGATAIAEAYGRSDKHAPGAAWTNDFVVVGDPDLSSRGLERIELRDSAREEAFLLLPTEYYFFEDVPTGTALKPKLRGEDDLGCCYGYTNARTRTWYLEYWVSPLAQAEITALEGSDLDSFNRWATQLDLRDDLEWLTRRGFDLSPSVRVDVELGPDQPPLSATVRVREVARPSADPSPAATRRYDLLFSRRKCAPSPASDGCAAGVSGWWLWKVAPVSTGP